MLLPWGRHDSSNAKVTAALEKFLTQERDPKRPLFLFAYYWDPHFDTALATAVKNHGSIPMITWEPFNPSNGVNQPQYALANITAGNFDGMITTWANEIKAYGSPIWLRLKPRRRSDEPCLPDARGYRTAAPTRGKSSSWRMQRPTKH
jgi:hypothetical protein